jgi:hypothetical protein
MSDIEEQLRELERRAKNTEDIPGAVRASEELFRTVRRQVRKHPESIDGEWAHRALHLYGGSLTLDALRSRTRGIAMQGEAKAEKAIRFLKRPARKSSTLRINLAVAHNVLAWALVESGELRQASAVNLKARRILTKMLNDRTLLSVLPTVSGYDHAFLLNEMGDACYTEAGIRGMQGSFREALRSNESAADYHLEATRADPDDERYRHQYEVVVDSLFRNAQAFGDRRTRQRIADRFDVG